MTRHKTWPAEKAQAKGTTMISYIVDKLPEGGYTVRRHPHFDGVFASIIFACTELDDALAFIKDKFEPCTQT